MLKKMLACCAVVVSGLLMPVAAQEKEIRVGALMAVSGPAAFIGLSQKNTFDLMVEQINARGGMSGYKIKPVFYDTEGNSTIAAQQFRRLAETDKVHVVIGPSTTGESLVVKPIANELKLPVISMGGAEIIVEPPTRYVYKVSPTDRIVAEHLLAFIKKKGLRSIAILSSADGYGQAGAVTVKEVAARSGLLIAAADEFGPRDADMTPQILKIRASGAEALLVWSVNPGPSIILRNATAVGYKQPIFLSNGGASMALIEQSGRAAENVYVSSSRLLAPDNLSASDPITPVVTQLVKDYRARFKAEPPGFAGNTYDALMLIEKSLEKIAAPLDREKLTDAFRSGIKFPGTNGMSDFTATKHGGLDRDSRSMVMMQVRQGRFQPLE